MKKPDDESIQAIAFSSDAAGKPAMSARGDGDFARQIVAVAEEHDVPVRQEAELVNLLSAVPMGDDIPELAMVAVAEVIAFIHSLEEFS